MKYEALNINLKVGMCVYDIDSCFPTTASRAILKPRRWIVEKIEEDGVWVRDRFLYYEDIYPTLQDCEKAIHRNTIYK